MRDDLADLPANAVQPSLMTGPHPRAAGSYGADACRFAAASAGLHMRPTSGLRWWQRLALHRALEHDEEGKLVWGTIIISAPRQVGKSFLERVACAWRIHNAHRFGEPQDVMHVAHKLNAAIEVWRPAARWEVSQLARVRWASGEQQIELHDGSRWMVQAANDGAGVSFSLSMALVDEAWRVPRKVVDGALAPTLIEAEQPQLWLVSTAGTSDSDLMLAYRAHAAANLEPGPDASALILEWSAPADDDLDIDDPAVWRAASPHWDERRAARVAQQRGQIDEWEFRQQWLNQWIPASTRPLFDTLAWQSAAWAGAFPTGALSFGADVAHDRSRAVIVGLCGGVAEVVDDRPGANWVAARLRDLAATWHPVGIGLDQSGPASTVIDQLAADDAADVVVPLNGADMATASGLVFDAISAGDLVATRQSVALAGAVSGARKRTYGQRWIFARDAPDGVALVALTAAHWASVKQPDSVEASAIW